MSDYYKGKGHNELTLGYLFYPLNNVFILYTTVGDNWGSTKLDLADEFLSGLDQGIDW